MLLTVVFVWCVFLCMIWVWYVWGGTALGRGQNTSMASILWFPCWVPGIELSSSGFRGKLFSPLSYLAALILMENLLSPFRTRLEPDCLSAPPPLMAGTSHHNCWSGLLHGPPPWIVNGLPCLQQWHTSQMEPHRVYSRSCHPVKTLSWPPKWLQSKGQRVCCGLGVLTPCTCSSLTLSPVLSITQLQSHWPHEAPSCSKVSAVLCRDCSCPGELWGNVCSHAVFLLKPAFALPLKLVPVPTYHFHHLSHFLLQGQSRLWKAGCSVLLLTGCCIGLPSFLPENSTSWLETHAGPEIDLLLVSDFHGKCWAQCLLWSEWKRTYLKWVFC